MCDVCCSCITGLLDLPIRLCDVLLMTVMNSVRKIDSLMNEGAAGHCLVPCLTGFGAFFSALSSIGPGSYGGFGPQQLPSSAPAGARHLQNYLHWFCMYVQLGAQERMHLLNLHAPVVLIHLVLQDYHPPSTGYSFRLHQRTAFCFHMHVLLRRSTSLRPCYLYCPLIIYLQRNLARYTW